MNHPSTRRWLLLGAWLLLVGGIIVGDDEHRLHTFLTWVNTVPYGDKMGHIFLVGTLAFLLNRALNRLSVPIWRWQVPVAVLIVMAVMTCEETSQIWIPWRTFDLGDLAANYTGCLLAWGISTLVPCEQ